ncbi:hypothetical protein [Thermodesulfovibrio sp. TK110]
MFYTFYSKNSGMEITTAVQGGEGKIFLRFFTFGNGNGNEQGIFMVDVKEAFNIMLICNTMVKGNLNQHKLIHKTDKNGQERIATLIFEKWQRNEKTGFAIVFKREENGSEKKINVPFNKADFLYFAELMRHISVALPYSLEKPRRQTQHPPAPVEKSEDIDYIVE